MNLNVIQLAAAAIAALIYGLVLYVVERLERIGCKCAMDWRRTFLEGFAKFALAWVALNAALGVWRPSYIAHPLFRAAAQVFMVLFFAYTVIGVTYMRRIRREDCKCSESKLRDVWNIILWVQVAMLVLAVLMGLVLARFFVIAARRRAAAK